MVPSLWLCRGRPNWRPTRSNPVNWRKPPVPSRQPITADARGSLPNQAALLPSPISLPWNCCSTAIHSASQYAIKLHCPRCAPRRPSSCAHVERLAATAACTRRGRDNLRQVCCFACCSTARAAQFIDMPATKSAFRSGNTRRAALPTANHHASASHSGCRSITALPEDPCMLPGCSSQVNPWALLLTCLVPSYLLIRCRPAPKIVLPTHLYLSCTTSDCSASPSRPKFRRFRRSHAVLLYATT